MLGHDGRTDCSYDIGESLVNLISVPFRKSKVHPRLPERDPDVWPP